MNASPAPGPGDSARNIVDTPAGQGAKREREPSWGVVRAPVPDHYLDSFQKTSLRKQGVSSHPRCARNWRDLGAGCEGILVWEILDRARGLREPCDCEALEPCGAFQHRGLLWLGRKGWRERDKRGKVGSWRTLWASAPAASTQGRGAT